MNVIILLIITAMSMAWDPVRPGALIQRKGEMLIVNQSVRIILKFDNVTYIQDNLNIIKDGLGTTTRKLKETGIDNVRINRKIAQIRNKVTHLEDNFTSNKKQKRALGVVIAIGALAGLGTINLGLNTELRNRVNVIEEKMARMDIIQEVIEDIQDSMEGLISNVEDLHNEVTSIRVSLDVFMLLDTLHIKICELENEVRQFIQDLVMSNNGAVTSTLLPIDKLTQVVTTAKIDWQFQPFFGEHNIALYYPLLRSYLNGSAVHIEVPFSTEFAYQIFQPIPFPMVINGTLLEVETEVTSPMNYALSIDNLKETKISNDELQTCTKTNINVYLCPPSYFTLREALVDSCLASLVRNVSVVENCQFKEALPRAKHVNIENSHYLFFPNQTKISVNCPGFRPEVAAIIGLYKVPDQCELNSEALTTIANRKRTVTIVKDKMLIDINIEIPKSSPPLRITKRMKRLPEKVVRGSGWDFKWISIPIGIIIVAVLIIICFIVYSKYHRPENFMCFKKRDPENVPMEQAQIATANVIRHVSATS